MKAQQSQTKLIFKKRPNVKSKAKMLRKYTKRYIHDLKVKKDFLKTKKWISHIKWLLSCTTTKSFYSLKDTRLKRQLTEWKRIYL